MPKKKPFIDKNRSVTFRLVHRSQKDPFIVDDECGDRVLAPIIADHQGGGGESCGDGGGGGRSSRLSTRKRKEEQTKYGVYFEDDYDYLQHLRDANEVVHMERVEPAMDRAGTSVIGNNEGNSSRQLKLPASLFECKDVQLKVGLLNQAAPAPGPNLDMDPEIAAILDDDDDDDDEGRIRMEYEELEDDFILKANAPGSGDEGDKNADDDDEGTIGRDNSEFGNDEEETRSRFTEYSLSSSVIPRSEGLQNLDARFEKLFEQYDDSEVGSLESEDDDEHSDSGSTTAEEGDVGSGLIDVNSRRMLEMADEFQEDQQERRNWIAKMDELHAEDVPPSQILASDDDGDDEDEIGRIRMDRIRVNDKSNQWDCESIISTYSNIYNHPTLIKEERSKKVRIDPKTGLPIEAFPRGGLTKKALVQLADADAEDGDERILGPRSVRSVASSYIRPKEETPEERRFRKQTVKMERRERRLEKKANKMAFKDEKLKRKDEDMNLRQNIQGLKLS